MAIGTKRRRILAAATGALIAVLGSVAITWARQALAPVVGSDMSLVFYLTVVIVSAAVGGLVAGLLATAMSLSLSAITIIGPEALADRPAEWIRVAVFTIEGISISVLVWLLQLRTARLSHAMSELESEKQLVARMALEDPLTGLRNRRALERDLAVLVGLALRDGSELTVVSADVDGLKATNDRYGHNAGDELLKTVSGLFVESCRASDVAYRVGGDEFVVLLPDTGPLDYPKWKERLEGALARTQAGRESVGVSLGAAHLAGDGRSPDDLLRTADERMYAMRAEGRATGTNDPGETRA